MNDEMVNMFIERTYTQNDDATETTVGPRPAPPSSDASETENRRAGARVAGRDARPAEPSTDLEQRLLGSATLTPHNTISSATSPTCASRRPHL